MAVKFSNINTSHTLLSNICQLERDHSDLRDTYISYVENIPLFGLFLVVARKQF